MKTIRYSILMVVVIAALTACSKKDNAPPSRDDFDPTKFYIAGTNPATGSSPGSNYVFLLRPGGVSTRYNYGGVHGPVDGSYTYSNGHLMLNPTGSNVPGSIIDFTIANNAITAVSASWQNFAGSTVLQKIPDADALSGKKFSGWEKFYTTGFGQRDLNIQFGTDGIMNGFYPFTMLNNGVALARSKDEGFFLYVIIGNTLTSSTVIPGSTSYIGYGEFHQVK